jgi:SsrA-binding protein
MNAKANPKSSDKKPRPTSRTAVSNRRAYHDYTVLETIDAGIVLTGTEIKSIRIGKASLNEAFARIENNEVWLYGMSISPYEQGNRYNHVPDRVRKLLLTRGEIRKLSGKIKQTGHTLIPLKLYFNRAWVKVELGLCQGKKLYDKRETLKNRDTQREIQRAMKQ